MKRFLEYGLSTIEFCTTSDIHYGKKIVRFVLRKCINVTIKNFSFYITGNIPSVKIFYSIAIFFISPF